MRAEPPPDVIGEYDEQGKELPRSYGAIIFGDLGRVLLCKPANEFDGYAWTFPKLRDVGGESQIAIACRAARKKAGVEGRVEWGRIPYVFRGKTSANVYYFVQPLAEHGDFDRSVTEQVVWATPDEAQCLIGETRNEAGRRRDLAVLEQALMWKPNREETE